MVPKPAQLPDPHQRHEELNTGFDRLPWDLLDPFLTKYLNQHELGSLSRTCRRYYFTIQYFLCAEPKVDLKGLQILITSLKRPAAVSSQFPTPEDWVVHCGDRIPLIKKIHLTIDLADNVDLWKYSSEIVGHALDLCPQASVNIYVVGVTSRSFYTSGEAAASLFTSFNERVRISCLPTTG